ncbi:MAG: nucleoid-associated protein [Ktedonobacterales bacterium]
MITHAPEVTEQASLSELTAPAPSSSSNASETTPAGASGNIRIERLILHHLDNRTGNLQLVDEEALLDGRGEVFFASHILAAARRADWYARFQDASGEVPALCRNLLATTGNVDGFVGASQRLARRLYDHMCQRPNKITPGDFVAIVYTADDRPTRHVALLKLDPDQERLIRTFERIHDRLRVSITTAGNLLPETIRLHKCALLTAHEDADDFLVTLLDTQAGPRSDGVAAFFYRDFLTTTLTASARRHTRLFLTSTEGWLDAYRDTLAPAAILRFYRARRLALTGERVTLADFAHAALPDNLQLQASLIAATQRMLFGGERAHDEPAPDSFAVDVAIARPFTQTVTLELDDGARIKVNAQRFDDLVQVAGQRTGENKFHLTLESLTLREVTG